MRNENQEEKKQSQNKIEFQEKAQDKKLSLNKPNEVGLTNRILSLIVFALLWFQI